MSFNFGCFRGKPLKIEVKPEFLVLPLLQAARRVLRPRGS
jgi:hypothetical protein